MRGFLFGILGLVVLEAVVANPRAYGAVGGAFGTVANATQRLFDANVPAIGPRPDTTSTGFKPTTTSATSGSLMPSVTVL